MAARMAHGGPRPSADQPRPESRPAASAAAFHIARYWGAAPHRPGWQPLWMGPWRPHRTCCLRAALVDNPVSLWRGEPTGTCCGQPAHRECLPATEIAVDAIDGWARAGYCRADADRASCVDHPLIVMGTG